MLNRLKIFNLLLLLLLLHIVTIALMKEKTSLKDITQQVGVPTALVSHLINTKVKGNHTGKAIAKKICAATAKPIYRPNQMAYSFKINKTNTIGFIVAKTNYRFTANSIRQLKDVG